MELTCAASRESNFSMDPRRSSSEAIVTVRLWRRVSRSIASSGDGGFSLSPVACVQDIKGASKVGDQHPYLRCLSRHNAAVVTEVSVVFHFHSLQEATVEPGRAGEEKAPIIEPLRSSSARGGEVKDCFNGAEQLERWKINGSPRRKTPLNHGFSCTGYPQ